MMKENYVHKSEYFYGEKISDYGLKNGRVDYRTLSQAFDAVLCNTVATLFYSDVNGEYVEPEQVNGFIDYSDEIDELHLQIEELEDSSETFDYSYEIEELREQIEELEELQARIDKAIEYIYENAYDEDRKMQVDDMWEEIPTLLEILKEDK